MAGIAIPSAEKSAHGETVTGVSFSRLKASKTKMSGWRHTLKEIRPKDVMIVSDLNLGHDN